MTKYIISVEFRYEDVPQFSNEIWEYNKCITIGICDNFDDACNNGNKFLEFLESRFPFHIFPDGTFNKNRFNKNTTLITNLAYIKIPFNFYAKIETLSFDEPLKTIEFLIEAKNRCIDFLNPNKEELRKTK